MPYSFTKIEQDKTRTIGFVFVFLIILYFLAAWIIYFVSKVYFLSEGEHYAHYAAAFSVSASETLAVLGIAFFIGLTHWFLATANLIPRLCGALQAEALNPKDTYHQMFQNIIDEVSIATGGRKIRGVVIPTGAMNAFAIADFEGQAVIGVTEGLLTRLSRAQIEAVVGHEAAHVVSGDCLNTTVAVSLFEVYATMLSRMKQLAKGVDGRSSGRGGGYVAILYGIIWLVTNVSYLLNMFISRQRELRADAVAVRLTRDPLSLAEALYAISNRWRGGGIPGEEIKAIFIVNPSYSRLDEGRGWFSDLFSTHPPVNQRLDVLLGMAHSDVATLEKGLVQHKPKQRIYDPGEEQIGREQISSPQTPMKQGVMAGGLPDGATNATVSREWIAHKDGHWLGPFTAEQMGTLDWLRPDSWIKCFGTGRIMMASEDEDVNRVFQALYGARGSKAAGVDCPKCRIPLSEISYEGVPVLKCPRCSGILVGETDIYRILIREDFSFSDRIAKMAGVIKKEQAKWAIGKIDLKTVNLLSCPKCQHLEAKMVRMFYSLVYDVEIDKCIFCGFIWFDKDELEILQYLVEKNTKKEI
ncbi:MAG TPA: zinc metalloprotease HtpX [Candidatus Omnitrophota bacterium]|nr:zinc metalloprotease HtpX [Candidatus Omnitrophota bacterium]HPD85612.1 zinc metalloprotease HtpX [Candidatus Omnitrophota bacterium]HRZ04455.1 zinc metalloprotease HtpX [Candidatus Omnitrophota bacterium]